MSTIQERFEAIKDITGVFLKAGLEIQNPALEMKRIIEENDLDRLELLELKALEWENSVSNKKRIEENILLGRNLQLVCDRAYWYVLGFNKKRNITSQQGDIMEAKFKEILGALKNGRPDKAYMLAAGVDPDGTLITDQMKSDVLEVISDAVNL